jgi:hypothetical protein
MNDLIFESWLARQRAEGMALARESALMTLVPEADASPRRYLAEFRCKTLVRSEGIVSECEKFAVAIQFPRDYLRVPTHPGRLLGLLGPSDVFHPNVRFPFICTGHLAPGTSLVELLFRVHEILTFQRLTPLENDALDPDACAWARREMHRFPLDRRPLKARAPQFEVTPSTSEEHS